VFAISYGLMWLLVLVQGVVILVLIHQIADIRTSAPTYTNALAPGTKAPPFAALDIGTREVVQSATLLPHATVLCFVSSECGDCRQLASELARYSADALKGLVLYCHGSAQRASSMLAGLVGTVPVLVEHRSDLAATYRLTGFPVAVLLDGGQIKRYEYPSRGREVAEYLSAARTDGGRATGKGSPRPAAATLAADHRS
jgi:hypothetical protein